MRKRIVVSAEKDAKAADNVAALKAVRMGDEEILVVTPHETGSGRSDDELVRLGAEADGVVLCGGPDLAPQLYGEEPRADANLFVMPELDALEWKLLEGARAGRTPVWAVCRGMQIANVFLGGTLWQDLPSQWPGIGDHYVRRPLDHLAHPIRVSNPASAFGALFGAEETRVNTRHHQAIKELARELQPIASSSDGVLEVVESRDGWWLRGVQWHPEDLLAIPLQKELWRQFVAEAVGNGRPPRRGTD